MVGSAFSLGELTDNECIRAWTEYLQVVHVVDPRTFLTELSKWIAEGSGDSSCESVFPSTARQPAFPGLGHDAGATGNMGNGSL